MRHYRRDGKPCSFWTWVRLFEDRNYKIVQQSTLDNGTKVSTVWLGLDHNFMEHGPPLIFETMVFAPNSVEDLDCLRYSTEADAIIGHDRMVRKWKRVVKNWKDLKVAPIEGNGMGDVDKAHLN